MGDPKAHRRWGDPCRYRVCLFILGGKLSKKTYYDVLKVSKNADLGVIVAAYRNLSQYYDSDTKPAEPHVERELRAINRAYEVLSDTGKRRKYDLSPWDAYDVPVTRVDAIPSSAQVSKPSLVSENSAHACKSSDEWLMKIWTYAVLPIFPLAILGFSFFGQDSREPLNYEQYIFIASCVALIYGLHKKQKWAWYFNWVGILALAAIPLKFGAIGGALGGLWIWWNYSAWKRLKQNFA